MIRRWLAASDRRQVAEGVSWIMAGTVAIRGLSLLAAIATARILGQEPFGQLALVTSTLQVLAVFSGFGLGATSV